MDETRFFLLIPVFNTEKYIRECLNSVKSQDYDNFQIIAVDDGSPDAAGQICDEYASIDQRITVLHQCNQGLIAARDTAIKYLKRVAKDSDIAMFLDSDDILAPGALRKLDKLFQRDNPDMIMYRWAKVDEKGNHIASPNIQGFTGYHKSKAELYKMVFSDWAYNSLCLKAVKSVFLTKDDFSEYYHLSGGEDLLRSIPLFVTAKKVLFISDELYYYRYNQQSITHTVDYDNYSVDTTIRSLVLVTLEHENVWTDQDFTEYLVKMGELLKPEIIRTIIHTSSKQKCYKILNDIYENEYYRKVISEASRRDLFLKLFAEKKYGILYIVFKMRSWLSKIKQSVIKSI